tara:strand:+ start:324 stop:1091 length:768 start_codon:yes stop_codon:yes gene_type:complete
MTSDKTIKVEWDYTSLADAYLMRPNYSDTAIDAMLKVMELEGSVKACDVGAGVAHLTLKLAAKNMIVTAIEPNDAMRENGINRTKNLDHVAWFTGTGEQTGQEAQSFDLVTFGSSFNVCDRQAALIETSRILKPKGWFACMWNHRQLDDPIQSGIEDIIKSIVPEYGYGVRREDQRKVIEQSNLFDPVVHLDAKVNHQQSVAECVEAWLSHATLQRQSGEMFGSVVDKIEEYLNTWNKEEIQIPYSTNIWLARLK